MPWPRPCPRAGGRTGCRVGASRLPGTAAAQCAPGLEARAAANRRRVCFLSATSLISGAAPYPRGVGARMGVAVGAAECTKTAGTRSPRGPRARDYIEAEARFTLWACGWLGGCWVGLTSASNRWGECRVRWQRSLPAGQTHPTPSGAQHCACTWTQGVCGTAQTRARAMHSGPRQQPDTLTARTMVRPF